MGNLRVWGTRESMKITELLKSHNLEAIRSYNELSIKVYEGDSLAFELSGTELVKEATPEETEELIRMRIGEYEATKNNG